MTIRIEGAGGVADKRYELALVLKKGGVIQITAEKIAKLKDLIGKVFGVIIVGQAWAMMEREANK